MNKRLENLREALQEKELDAILISTEENRRYVSGFSGSAGYLLVSQNDAVLATDFRYVEQAGRQSPDFRVERIAGGHAWLPKLTSEMGMDRSVARWSKQRRSFHWHVEFPLVFVTGLEEGLLPHVNSFGEDDQMEEERRLFYVGMTRTKSRLFLSASRFRTIHGSRSFRRPSRFLEEIGEQHLDGSGTFL